MYYNNLSFPICIPGHEYWPVASVEDDEDDGQEDLADQLKLEESLDDILYVRAPID